MLADAEQHVAIVASVGSKIIVGGYASTSRSVLNDVSSAHSTGNAHTASSSAATDDEQRGAQAARAYADSTRSPLRRTRNITNDTASVIASSTIASAAP